MNQRSTSARALARSYRTERTLTFVVGLGAVLGAAAVFAVSFGLFGEFRARRPLMDPIAVDWLGGHATLARIVAIVLGVVLFVLGLRWFLRSLRPEGRPDLVLERSDNPLTVTSSAIANAVQADAETVGGVNRARARAVGDSEHPALRLTLWLREGTDVRQVWDELDTRVLRRARESLGIEVLPTAVRIELESGNRQRVV
ncbi:MAG: hypothetical protein QOI21_1647 [Actinomycetota bacterium]|jgi:hypothetical protein|nr:hypothetical protein [Actinomycetota bacterium]